MPGLCEQKATGAMEIFGHLSCSPACLCCNPVHHLLRSRDMFSSGQRQNLKRLASQSFVVWLHFSHSAGAHCNHIPDAADSSSLILHPCRVVYHCLSIDSCAVVHNNTATVMACFQSRQRWSLLVFLLRQCYVWWNCSWKHEKTLCNCFLL